MRHTSVSRCALVFAALVALQVSARTTFAQQPAAAANRITAALDSSSRAEFIDASLTTVVDFYRDLHGIPILIDLPALDEIGISVDQLVSFQLDDTRFETVLDLLLMPLDLTWTIYDNVLLITSSERAEVLLTVEVYPLGDLVEALLAHGVSVAGLIDAIQTNVQPQSWEEVGGPASISALGDVLVVSQTPGTHRAVARLLGQLQEKLPATAAARRPAQGETAADDARPRHCDRVRSALAGPIDLDMAEVPLADVVAYIADFAGIEVLLDVQALAAQGVAANMPMTLSLSNVRLSTALTVLLDPLALDYAVEDEVLLITTRQRADGPLARLAVYDVSTMAFDQTEAMAIAQSVAAASLTPSIQYAGGGFGGAGVMVPATTSVTAVRQSLVVRASERQHERIIRLLTDLARATYRQRPSTGHSAAAGECCSACERGACETGARDASAAPQESATRRSGLGGMGGGFGGGAFGEGASGRGGGFGGGLH